MADNELGALVDALDGKCIVRRFFLQKKGEGGWLRDDLDEVNQVKRVRRLTKGVFFYVCVCVWIDGCRQVHRAGAWR